ncbi:glycosyltransferase family 2 protein [Soonwooa purpurea]
MISIIIPIYNSEDYLEACLESVLVQTFKDFELLLINDGSTDRSREICDVFAEKDNRIKVYHEKNKGQAAARNFGLKQVTRPFVTFLDADDEISSDTLESNLKILVNNPKIDCLQYPTYVNYGTDKQFVRSSKEELITSDFYKAWLKNKQISWVVWDKIYKTKVFENFYFTEGIVYEDNLLIANLLERINNLYISKEGMYYYYVRDNSTMTSVQTLKKEEDSFFVTSKIAEKLFNHHEKKLLIEFILRLVNIKKSLNVNFSKNVDIPNNLVKSMSVIDVLLSKISFRGKMKLFIEKYAN